MQPDQYTIIGTALCGVIVVLFKLIIGHSRRCEQRCAQLEKMIRHNTAETALVCERLARAEVLLEIASQCKVPGCPFPRPEPPPSAPPSWLDALPQNPSHA